ncbi:Sugar transporter SWEET1 [Gryllus bimaculatus]|nr:Sugar transporter SWEET1 [Gryllus bimaculatus]
MGLSDYKEAVGTCASLCTILQLLVPIFMCRKFMIDGTTGETSSLPFVVGFLSSSLWLKYGLMQGEPSLIIVNSVGAIMQLCYIAVFYLYCPRKMVVIQQLLGVALIQALTILYTIIESDQEVAIKRVGMLCCFMTIAFFAAPLTQLAHIIQTGSSESLPFPLTLATFTSSLLWLIYGFIIDDPNVKLPNIIGTTLSALQLSLFVIFPAPRRSPDNRTQVVHVE